METKNSQVEEKNENTEKTQSNRTYGVLRTSIQRLGFDEVLDFLTQFSLKPENKELLKNIKQKINERREMRKVFVRSIGYNSQEEDFRQAMDTFGEVEECLMVKDQETKKPKGFGFVIYRDIDSAFKALEVGCVEIAGRMAYIHFAVYNYKEDGNRSSRDSHDRSGGYDNQRSTVEKRRENQIFIRNLGDEIDIETIRNVFKKYGPIEEAFVPKDKETGRQRGYGFVKYFSPESASRCLEEPDKEINGIIVKCDYSSKRKKANNNNNQYSSYNQGTQMMSGQRQMYAQNQMNASNMQMQQSMMGQYANQPIPVGMQMAHNNSLYQHNDINNINGQQEMLSNSQSASDIKRDLQQLQMQQKELLQRLNSSQSQQAAYQPASAQGYYGGDRDSGRTTIKRKAQYYNGSQQGNDREIYEDD